MKRFAFLIVALPLLFAGTGRAWGEMLYAVSGAGGTASVLYRIDAATGNAQVVGPTGFTHVTALSFNPVTGVLYGHQSDITGSGATNLLAIDPTTGAGTVIGSTGQQIPDMSFSASGVLYAWSEGMIVTDSLGDPSFATNDDLYRIDPSTGAATKVGESGLITVETGLAFDKNGTLWLKPSNDLYTLDPNTGLASSTAIPLTASIDLKNVLAFDENNVAYSISRRNGQSFLEKIDVVTGQVTEIGSIKVGDIPVAGISALAFQPVPVPASLTLFGLGGLLLMGHHWLRRRRALAAAG
jgi:sugar lactone lactonase YvrE